MYYVYILKCRDDSFYTGYTNDIEKRIERHGKGNASRYTRSRLPVKLVASWSFSTRKEAMKREAQIKNMARDEKIKLIGRS